jgi:hypothetical protein
MFRRAQPTRTVSTHGRVRASKTGIESRSPSRGQRANFAKASHFDDIIMGHEIEFRR